MAVHLMLPDPTDEDCCALVAGHDGPCARVCPECNGSQRCRECDDQSIDDFSGCGECGSAGGCSYCYEGMVTEEETWPTNPIPAGPTANQRTRDEQTSTFPTRVGSGTQQPDAEWDLAEQAYERRRDA